MLFGDMFKNGPLGDANQRQMIGLQMLANSGPSVGAPGNLFAGLPQAVMAGKQLSEKQREKMQEDERKRNIAKALAAIDGIDPELARFDPDMALKVAQMKATAAKGSSATYGKTPIYGKDENGKTVLGVVGDDGSFKSLDTGGFEVGSPIQEINTGTEIIFVDKRTGQEIGRTPIQNYQKSFDSAAGDVAGRADAENKANLPFASAAAKNNIRLVDEVLTHPGLEDAVGPLQGMLPSFTSSSRDFDNRVSQLKDIAFLQARKELKGGGAITDFEGEKAEKALNRASQATDEATFKKAMMEFRNALVRGYQILEEQAGGGSQGAGLPSAPGPRRRFNPETGEIE
jgi:hypothetical protein